MMTMPEQIIMRAVGGLIPYARNARIHSAEQIAQIAASDARVRLHRSRDLVSMVAIRRLPGCGIRRTYGTRQAAKTAVLTEDLRREPCPPTWQGSGIKPFS
jgi:hypothetical protein